jgi:hypothetical protein
MAGSGVGGVTPLKIVPIFAVNIDDVVCGDNGEGDRSGDTRGGVGDMLEDAEEEGDVVDVADVREDDDADDEAFKEEGEPEFLRRIESVLSRSIRDSAVGSRDRARRYFCAYCVLGADNCCNKS